MSDTLNLVIGSLNLALLALEPSQNHPKHGEADARFHIKDAIKDLEKIQAPRSEISDIPDLFNNIKARIWQGSICSQAAAEALTKNILDYLKPYLREPRRELIAPTPSEELVADVEEYLHWRKVNPQIKGGENYLKRFRQSMAAKVGFVEALQEAKNIVAAYPLHRKFINGTPLENDIAVMMAEFAIKGGKA